MSTKNWCRSRILFVWQMSKHWTQQHDTMHTLFQFITRAGPTLVYDTTKWRGVKSYSTNCSGAPSVARNSHFILVHLVSVYAELLTRRVNFATKPSRSVSIFHAGKNRSDLTDTFLKLPSESQPAVIAFSGCNIETVSDANVPREARNFTRESPLFKK